MDGGAECPVCAAGLNSDITDGLEPPGAGAENPLISSDQAILRSQTILLGT